MIKIEVSQKDVAYLLGTLNGFPKECQGAMWQAVKRSLMTARKELTNEIAKVSYLQKSMIREAILPVQMFGKKKAAHDRRYQVDDRSSVFGVIRISGRKMPLDAYKLVPDRPTRPKGMPREKVSRAGFKLGPGRPVQHWGKSSGRSEGFVLRGKSGKLRFMVEKLGRRHRWQGRSVPTLIWVKGYPVQYFAVFDDVAGQVGGKSKKRFIDVLKHEIDFRITKLASQGKMR